MPTGTNTCKQRAHRVRSGLTELERTSSADISPSKLHHCEQVEAAGKATAATDELESEMSRVVNELNVAKTHVVGEEGVIGELHRMLTQAQVSLGLAQAGPNQREAELDSPKAALYHTRDEAQRAHAEL